MQFTAVLALYDPFGVDVPLNLDIPPDDLYVKTHVAVVRHVLLI